MITKEEAIRSLYEKHHLGIGLSGNGNLDNISSYTLLDGSNIAFTQSDVDAELVRLQAEYDTQEYARNRATVYASVGDQLDMLMKDMKNGTTTHQEACEAVKAKYPKPRKLEV